MMRPFAALLWLALCLVGTLQADDEQVAVYAVTSPLAPQYSGAGLALSTRLLPRMTVDAVLDTTDLSGTPDVRLGLQGRLLFSADLFTQWYPVAGVQLSSATQGLQGTVGVGFQRRLGPGIRFYSEGLWHSEPASQQLRLGIRFWLLRMDSLDRRMRRAEPRGAVYQGGPVPSSKVDSLLPAGEPALGSPAVSSAVHSARPSREALKDPDAEILTETPAAPTTESKTVSTEAVSGWYLQLGVFREQASVQRLQNDPRLDEYHDRISLRYDDALEANRVLLGPMSKAEAERLKTQLSNAQMDSLLYDGRGQASTSSGE